MPGPGHSSPIVWGDRLFLTAFEPEPSLFLTLLGRRGRLFVLGIERSKGAIVWKTVVPAREIENTTSINQPASPTPVTDGRNVYAYFGSYGIVALDFAGRRVWGSAIGPFPNHMGSGSSPLLVKERIYLNVESDGPAWLYAIEAASGRVVWQTKRKTPLAAYASPVMFGSNIVIAGSERLTAYDAGTGQERWNVGGLSTYVVPTPVTDGARLYATSSGPGGNAVMAITPEGTIAWRASKGAAYVASPVVHEGRVFTVNRNCVVSCVDGRTGAQLRSTRLTVRGECDASPVIAGGTLYVVAGSGELYALDADQALRERGRLDLGERVIASPAVSAGRLYVRSDRHLFALAGEAN